MATLKGMYEKDQSVIGKLDNGMQKLMIVAKEASSKSAGHTQMHTAWGAVHDVLEALYMKPNPKSEGSPTATTSKKGAETKIDTVDALPAAAAPTTEATTTPPAAAAAAAPPPPPPAAAPPTTTPETNGGGHCDKKSKRRRRKGRKGRRATKKK